MGGSRGLRWALGSGVVVLVAGCGWAALSVWRNGAMESQDVAGVLGLPLGIFSALVGAVVGLSALRLQQAADARAVALDRLARAVQDVEVAERTHMLGTGAHLIDLPVDVTPRRGGAEPSGRQRLSDVAAWYCAAPGRLVVTGEPGAGKTVLAVHLVVRLLDVRAETDPVPVRLAIRDLPPARTRRRWWGRRRTVGGFERWLKDSLVKAYEVPGAAAADLVARRLVVPVLDGLDEMDPDDARPDRASDALAELNAYQSVGGSAPLVLTCRERRYEELSARHAWLREAARLRIGGVDADQARQYVDLRSDGRSSPMDAVVDAMRDGAVAEALSSPFYLGLAFAVYGEPTAPPPAAGASAAEIREQLLARYVPAATRSANAAVRQARKSLSGGRSVWGREREYEADSVRRWLGRMAGAAERGGVTLGRVVGGRVTGVVSVVAVASAVVAALCVVPMVRGLVPEGWWVRHGGLFEPLSVVGPVALGAAFLSWALLCEDSPLGSSERVRQPRPRWPEQLRKVLRWGVLLTAITGLLVLGAAARFSDAYAAVSPETWYVFGIVAALGGGLAYAVDEPFDVYTSGRGLFGCVALPVPIWAAAWTAEETGAGVWNVGLVVLLAVAVVLWRRGVLTAFALLGGLLAAGVGASRGSLTPDGGFEPGAATGGAVFYALACAFLGPGSGPRILDAIGRLWSRTPWPTWLVSPVVLFFMGLGGEAQFGFAGVVFIVVACGCAVLGLGLARGLTPLVGAALGRVPPRPGAFLAWAYHAGLLRVVGGAYQFRHRELQEWLDRNPG
ncbi:NACHT domain-containing protein [Streptomyces sp. NPDC059063]|uniref:NACHT domain-containing protein n=1 Tax=unclassified Streptomyces TaxID=2593676 RepID=UPI00367E59DA